MKETTKSEEELQREEEVEMMAICEKEEIKEKAAEVIETIIEDKNLPNEAKISALVGVFHSIERISSPVPPPNMMSGYNEEITDGANRIMAMAEKEQEHRHKSQNDILSQNMYVAKHSFSAAKRGHYLAFTVVVLLIGSGVFALIKSATSVAIVIFTTAIIGAASVFIKGHYKQGSKKVEDPED